MKNPLGVSPSKGNQGTTRGKEKFLLTSVGIDPTTSGLDLPLLCRLSYLVPPFVFIVLRGTTTTEVVRQMSEGRSPFDQIFWFEIPCDGTNSIFRLVISFQVSCENTK